jgi:hypothetical protein
VTGVTRTATFGGVTALPVITSEDLMEEDGFTLAALHWAAKQDGDGDYELVLLVEAEVRRRREMLNRAEAPLLWGGWVSDPD